MDAILKRRSIRSYTGEGVCDADVRDLLRAAMSAPSAGNERPWHFIVIRDRATMQRIITFHPYAAMLTHAPLAICVCGDLSLEKYRGFWVQDCSAATENLLIAAQDLGLGACWLGIYPLEDRVAGMSNLLGCPGNVVPFAVIAVGHPAEEKEYEDRYDASRVHDERW